MISIPEKTKHRLLDYNLKEVVLLLNNEASFPEKERGFFSSFLQKRDCPLIVVDGGYKYKESFIPILIVGDLDSISSSFLEKEEKLVWKLPREKDFSDTEAVFKLLTEIGRTEKIYIFNWKNGRLDHQFFNLFFVAKYDFNVFFLSLKEKIYYPRKNKFFLSTREKSIISLLPLTEKVYGITSSGLKYQLKDDTICQNSTRTLSNIAEEKIVSLKWEKGKLLVYEFFSDN